MKTKRLITLLVGISCSLGFLTGCSIVKSLEEELNVVFKVEGEFIESGTVTQFKNIKSPTISDAYVPTDYKFVGWTCYAENELDLNNATNFKKQYIRGGAMVHYMDIQQFAENKTVTMQALIMDKNDIPKDYHYAVVAWYDNSKSGLTQAKMDDFANKTKAYLASEGVSEDDINSLVFRGYQGQVGASTAAIINDDDVDLMFGWGSADNITTTGNINPAEIRISIPYVIAGNNRHLHRISDSEGGIKLQEYLTSDDIKTYFA